jgi:hypothetical protein
LDELYIAFTSPQGSTRDSYVAIFLVFLVCIKLKSWPCLHIIRVDVCIGCLPYQKRIGTGFKISQTHERKTRGIERKESTRPTTDGKNTRYIAYIRAYIYIHHT